MIIKGIGIDLIEVDRIRQAVTRRREGFRRRVFTPAEWDYCLGGGRLNYASLAARFAAKEAVFKALGCGWRQIPWREVEICKGKGGEPLINLGPGGGGCPAKGYRYDFGHPFPYQGACPGPGCGPREEVMPVWVLTGSQMRERDRWATGVVGLPEMVLMENAGRQVAVLARRLLGETVGKRVWIFAGQGNNGGDGLVAARYLAKAGVEVEIFLLAPGEKMRVAAAEKLHFCRQIGLEPVEINADGGMGGLYPRCGEVSLVIDAILGTAFGPVRVLGPR